MKQRVVVAMSGGVDSSVTAALLQQMGYEVIGITMCFNLPDASSKKPRCCGLQGIEDARRVAHKLGIKHYVLNMQKALDKFVIQDFCKEYLKGRTPNPCVLCNQHVKFEALLKKALFLGAAYLATGHYARVGTESATPAYHLRPGVVRGKQYLLKKAKDKAKDQSYFLYRLGQRQLRHILFPLGNYTKPQVRELARKFALPVAEKLDSQEICFLPGPDYRSFLKSRMAGHIKPGPIVDTKGRLLGEHKGIAFYTIGQREGLGIAAGYPIYITKIEPRRNRIVVGSKEEALAREFLVKTPHFVAQPVKKKVALKVKIRYNHTEASASVEPAEEYLKVIFREPQFAITPGQSAVFYSKDTVIGGGIIDEVIG